MANPANAQNSPFAESMERLDQVVRSVKMQQIEERQGPLQIASNRMNAISPDELWARQFSNQCIGPVCFGPAPAMDMPLPPLANVMQSFSAERQTAYPAAPVKAVELPMSAALGDGPIGRAIGKNVRNRGFLRWLSGRK